MVRACAGDLGLLFEFSGLATLSSVGLPSSQRATLSSQVGLKIVLGEQWMVHLYFGAAFDVFNRGSLLDGTREGADWSTGLGTGFRHHFRIWRRISPFVGANLGFGYRKPTGAAYALSVGVEGVIGIEYYIADRLSLSAQYMVSLISLVWRPSELPSNAYSERSIAFAAGTGGGTVLTFYF